MREEGSLASTKTGSNDRSLTQMISRARLVKRRLPYQSPRRLVGIARAGGTWASRRLMSLRVQRMVSTCATISCRLHSLSRPRRTTSPPHETLPVKTRLEYHTVLSFEEGRVF